jgi:hypothetical protein
MKTFREDLLSHMTDEELATAIIIKEVCKRAEDILSRMTDEELQRIIDTICQYEKI